MKIDLKDRKILYELDLNCRQSNSQIAKKVGLSKQVVNYRIKRLEEQKIILSYVSVINLSKLGLKLYRVMLQFKNVSPQKEQEIISAIKANNNVHWEVSAFGNWDHVFSISSKSDKEFKKNLANLLHPFRKYIKKREFIFISNLYQFSKSYLIDKKNSDFTFFENKNNTEKIDKVDYKILKILAVDARENLVSIAAKVKVSLDVVRYRIKKLIRQGIVQWFRAVINREMLGYQYWNVIANLSKETPMIRKDLIEFLRQTTHVIYASTYVGNTNFGFELEVKDIIQLQEILLNFRYQFADILKSYECILFIKEHKLQSL